MVAPVQSECAVCLNEVKFNEALDDDLKKKSQHTSKNTRLKRRKKTSAWLGLLTYFLRALKRCQGQEWLDDVASLFHPIYL